jgi:hypothetical protein
VSGPSQFHRDRVQHAGGNPELRRTNLPLLLICTQIEGVHLIPVAAPGHLLAKACEAAPLPARDFVQLVLSEKPVAGSQEDAETSKKIRGQISQQNRKRKNLT